MKTLIFSLLFVIQQVTRVELIQLDLRLGDFRHPNNVSTKSPNLASSTRAVSVIRGSCPLKLNYDDPNSPSWNGRYFYNGQFFSGNGPMYVYVGGSENAEGYITFMKSGLMYDMATQNNGYMFILEHRGFGQSNVASDYTVRNMRYITTRQALGDIAEFVKVQKTNNPALANSKVVLIGGGYGGALAAWARNKYPSVITSAVSDSAAISYEVNDQSFYNFSFNSLLDPYCTNVVKLGFYAIYDMMNSTDGQAQLLTDYRFCNGIDFTNPNDRSAVFMQIADVLSNSLVSSTTRQLFTNCMSLTYPITVDDYSRFRSFIRPKIQCIYDYKSLTALYQTTSKSYATDSRTALYLKCNELGRFSTYNIPQDNLPDEPSLDIIPLMYYYNLCTRCISFMMVPAKINASVANTNTVYGGLNPHFTQVATSYGSLDPGRNYMLQANGSSASSPLFVVSGVSKGAVLTAPTLYDSTALKNARLSVKAATKSWTG